MAEKQPVPQNKMGTMPVNQLLLSMAIPIMISMMVQAFYNMVDGIFVGQLSENALNAVSLAFPIQNLIISVAVGTGVGINALLGRRLGQGESRLANQTAMNGLFLSLLNWILFAILAITCTKLFYASQTDIAEIIHYGEQYTFITTAGSFGIFFAITLERLLQVTGRTMYTMVTQAVGAIINIVLDPILIFGLFGAPRLEVAGAALATIIGQVVACMLALYFNLHHNPEIEFRLRGFRPSAPIIRDIYRVGFPSIIMSSIGSVMVFAMNQILIVFTPTATAVFGIYFKLQSFVFMPVFGLTNGMTPIVAYNFGAKNPDRIVKTVKLACMYAVGVMTIGFLLFQLFPATMIGLFQEKGASGDLITLGIPALRKISFCFLIAGFSIVSSTFFQAMGHGMLSLILSAIRQLVVLLPVAFILSRTYGLDAIWWAFPIAEIFAGIICIICISHLYRKEILPMKQAQE